MGWRLGLRIYIHTLYWVLWEEGHCQDLLLRTRVKVSIL